MADYTNTIIQTGKTGKYSPANPAAEDAVDSGHLAASVAQYLKQKIGMILLPADGAEAVFRGRAGCWQMKPVSTGPAVALG